MNARLFLQTALISVAASLSAGGPLAAQSSNLRQLTFRRRDVPICYEWDR
jgi:hypothetical protein